MKQVTIITDGSTRKNPGPGGWACILKYEKHEKELSGSDPNTTNNRMELTAAIRGLEALKEPCEVTLITDSEYVQKGISIWIRKWKMKNWLNYEKKPVANKELWIELDQLCQKHKVKFVWVKAHDGHVDNERCDALAKKAAFCN